MSTLLERDARPSEAVAALRTQIPKLRSRLQALASLAERAEEPELAREARRMDQELRVERLRIAFVGEFKAGKSTLINALLNDEVVPVKLRECTATVCRVRRDPRGTEGIRARLPGRPLGPVRPLRDLATLAQDRSADAEEVEVTITTPGWPGPEVELVDTPGAQAGGLAGERCTLAWLPRADAVVFVTRADRPLGKAELRLLREHVLLGDRKNAFLVVNHTDALATRAERARVQDRIASAVREATGGCPPILFVSAADARDAQDAIAEVEGIGRPEVGTGEIDALESSGIPTLRGLLDEHLVQQRVEVLMDAHNERQTSLQRRLRLSLRARLEDAHLDAEAANRRIERLRTLQQVLANVPTKVHASEKPHIEQLRSRLDVDLDEARIRLANQLRTDDKDAARAVLQEVADRLQAHLKHHQNAAKSALQLAMAELIDTEAKLSLQGPKRVEAQHVDVCMRTVKESNDMLAVAVGAGLVALFTAPGLLPFIAWGAATMSSTTTRSVVDADATTQQAIAGLRASMRNAIDQHEQRLQTAINQHVTAEIQALRRRIDAISAPASSEHTAKLRALVAELDSLP